MIRPVPELADGGYWYTVRAVIDDSGAKVPDLPEGTEYCASYGTVGAVEYAAVRLLSPTVVAPGGVPVLDVLASANLPAITKPRGRIRGR